MVKRRASRTKIFNLIVFALILLITIFGLRSWLLYNYPLKYENLIEKYSEEFNIDKIYIYSIIKTESGFNPDSTSNLGARGLMQIMPDAFDWIKLKLNDESEITYDEMYDIENNIKYGTFLIDYLYEEFGDIKLAAAAYHAGRGQVNSWLDNPEYSEDGVSLLEIPTNDTRHYVDKIEKAIRVYEFLYEFNKS